MGRACPTLRPNCLVLAGHARPDFQRTDWAAAAPFSPLTYQDWNINWQAVYTYREPVAVSKGVTVHMRIIYDNSAQNPRNPDRPPKRVHAGDRAEDEMGHVWLQVLPRENAQRARTVR